LDQTNLATVSHGTLVTSMCQSGPKVDPPFLFFIQYVSKRSAKPGGLNFYNMKI
jgi:hypothetical protein